MIGFALLLGAAGAGLAPAPPPIEQLTADCKAPVYASDMMVCADAELAAADAALASLVEARLAADTGGSFRGEQAAWFRSSRRCAFEAAQRDCLVAAYSLRIAVLAAPR